jgi:transposase InsO family protein
MQFTYTHRKKNECVAKIKDFVQLVQQQWGYKVKTIFSDNKMSFGRDFKTFIASEGIVHHTSVPGTPEQNSFAERSGGVIIARTRRIRIAAQLPHELWPWLVKAAIYQLNRTPTKRLGWKTPYEALTGEKPNILNCYTIGSAAYIRDNVKRSMKFEPRAKLGYLVAYNASNIWDIWLPAQKKVVRARDVVF